MITLEPRCSRSNDSCNKGFDAFGFKWPNKVSTLEDMINSIKATQGLSLEEGTICSQDFNKLKIIQR